jgi:cystathionine gamma-lyase
MSGLTTKLIHSSYDASDDQGAIIPPIHLSTTFKFGNERGYDYSRSDNPTRKALEETLAAIDGGKHGLAYSSGSAALANIAALLHEGEEILFSSDAYGGTYRYVTQVLSKTGIKHKIVDFTNLEAVRQVASENNIKLIWSETPTNPLLKVTDIRALSEIAHQNDAILVVDNTFLTPVAQRPLEHGADIVVYSTTKFINGHSDSVDGSLVVNDDKLYEELKFLQNAIGAILSPFDSWLTLRGLRTLEVRIKQHNQTAQKIAKTLQESDKVKRVFYPGLFTGEQGEIVKRQQILPGAIVSVELNDNVDVQKFLNSLKYFPLAESLVGVESLIDHPASMTHAAIPAEERAKIGLSDGLFRISVGIENTEDLVDDIQQALDNI